MMLEDRLFLYLQEIYNNLIEFYMYIKEYKSNYVLSKMGVDGFESNLVINKMGEIFLPATSDGIFYGSKVKKIK